MEKEEYLYHGRLYLRAEGAGWPSSARLKLYLDQSDGVLGEASGTLLTASRLGMTFDGAASSAVILRLTENESPRGQQVYNTVIGGQTLAKKSGACLGWNRRAGRRRSIAGDQQIIQCRLSMHRSRSRNARFLRWN